MGKTWFVNENSTTWLDGFNPRVLPNGLEKRIRIITRANAIGLEVGGVVGSVPLHNGETLHIVPKVGRMNFFRMLLTAEGLQDFLTSDFTDFVRYDLSEEDSIPQLVAKSYLHQISFLQSSSLRFIRSNKIQTGEFASGAVIPLPTVLRLRLKSSKPIVFSERVRNVVTPENRLLAAAAIRAFEYLNSSYISPDIARTFHFWKKFYDPRCLTQDLAEVNHSLSKGKYLGSRGYYVKALTIAKLLLSQAGIAQGSIAEIEGDGALINTSHLFEQYLRSLLTIRYGREGIIVRKGGSPGRTLYTNGDYGLIPDITITRGSQYLAIGDAKYKDSDAGDHYQLCTYLAAYGVKTGFLLRPSSEKVKNVGIIRHTTDKRSVFEIHLPLDDLDATERIINNLHQVVPFLQS